MFSSYHVGTQRLSWLRSEWQNGPKFGIPLGYQYIYEEPRLENRFCTATEYAC